MHVQKCALTGQRCVHIVADLVAPMGWLFREQPVHDYGIDAIVEVVEAEQATGQLLAFQIKAGASAVKEADDEIRTSRPHLVGVVAGADAAVVAWPAVLLTSSGCQVGA